MPINYPDNVKHNNSAFPIISASDLTVQGWYHVANTTERDAIPAAKRLTGAVVVVGTAVYVYTGGALDDTAWQTSGNWSEVGSGTIDHGVLTGLGDDDHTQYVLADGTRTLTSLDVTNNAEIGGNLGINVTGSPTAPLHIEGTGTTDAIYIESSDAGSDAGPVITLKRDSASPASADYLGQLKFKGESSTGADRVYAKITAKIDDPTNGAEDGIIEFMNRFGGSSQIALRLKEDSFRTLNGVELHVDGNTGLGNNNPSEKLDVTGNIAVSGTVDGRDLTADGTKLDGIETGATADQAWGDIGGTLSNQTDLQSALDAKANSSHTHVLADITDSGDLAALDTVGTTEIDDNAITSAKILDGTIVTADLADQAVTNAKLVVNAVSTSRLQDDSVTTSKIVDANVTNAKLQNGSVSTDKLATGAVTSTKIASGGVSNSNLNPSLEEKLVYAEEPVEPFMPWSGEVTGTFSNRRTYSPFELDRFLGRGSELAIDLDGTPLTASQHQNLTNQSYGSALNVAAAGGNTGVLTIDLETNGLVSSNGFTYAQGYLMLTFYSGRGPVSMSCRTQDKNGTWTNRTCTAHMTSNNTPGAAEAVYWGVQLGGNYLVKIELTMTSQTSGQFIGLGNISYLGTRMQMSQGPQINTLGGKFFGQISGVEQGTTNWTIDQDGSADFDSLTIQGSPITSGADGADGADGDGFTGGSYNSSTGVVTFTSDDGLGFSTGDLRGADGADGLPGANGTPGADGDGFTGGSYNSSTGVVTFTSDDGLGFSTGDLRGADGADGSDALALGGNDQTLTSNRTIDDGNTGKLFFIDLEAASGEKSQVLMNPNTPSIFLQANDGTSVSAFTIGSANINLQFTGTSDLRVNNDEGTSGQVLTSNGTGSAPTWEYPEALHIPRWTFSDFNALQATSNSPFVGAASTGGNTNGAVNNDAYTTTGSGWVMIRAGTGGTSGYRWDTQQQSTNFQAGMSYVAIFNTHANSTDRKAWFGFKDTTLNVQSNQGVYYTLDGLTLTATLDRSSGTFDTGTGQTLSANTTYMVEIKANSASSFTFYLYAAPTGNQPGALIHSETLTMTNALDASTNMRVGMAAVRTTTGTANYELLALDYMGFGYR